MICKKCNVNKELLEFTRDRKLKSGYKPICKDCLNSKRREAYQNNSDKFLEYSKKWKDNNKDKIKEYHKSHIQPKVVYEHNTMDYSSKICNRCGVEKDLDFYYKDSTKKDAHRNICKDCENINKKNYRNNNPELIKEQRKNNYLLNKTLLNEKSRIYAKNNRAKISETTRVYNLYRRHTDNFFRLKGNLRTLILNSITKRGFTKKSKTCEILGCSFDEVRKYFESKFESWMTWDNYGKYNGEFNYGWDIDHIKGLALATNENELIKLSHYTNLQPLCSKINRDIKR